MDRRGKSPRKVLMHATLRTQTSHRSKRRFRALTPLVFESGGAKGDAGLVMRVTISARSWQRSRVTKPGLLHLLVPTGNRRRKSRRVASDRKRAADRPSDRTQPEALHLRIRVRKLMRSVVGCAGEPRCCWSRMTTPPVAVPETVDARTRGDTDRMPFLKPPMRADLGDSTSESNVISSAAGIRVGLLPSQPILGGMLHRTSRRAAVAAHASNGPAMQRSSKRLGIASRTASSISLLARMPKRDEYREFSTSRESRFTLEHAVVASWSRSPAAVFIRCAPIRHAGNWISTDQRRRTPRLIESHRCE